MAWWGSPTHDANGASRGVPRAYNQRYTDDQRPTGGTSETAGRGFRHVHRRRTRTFGGCPGWLDRGCRRCLYVGGTGLGAGRNSEPPIELVPLPLINLAVSPPRVEGAGGLVGLKAGSPPTPTPFGAGEPLNAQGAGADAPLPMPSATCKCGDATYPHRSCYFFNLKKSSW